MEWEKEYKKLIAEILETGEEVETRNGVRISVMNKVLTCDLSEGFPIVTGRHIPFEKIVEEFLWFLRGQTNTKILDEKGVKIWNANSSREYLDSHGLTFLEEGDIGPGYGFQLRNFGKDYFLQNSTTGRDQWQYVVNLLQKDPASTRILFSFWDARQLNTMALPPCHVSYQFLVRGGKLHCTFYQRSWDVLLGWNMSTAALFTHALSHITGIPVGTVTHMIADAHIYKIHKKQAQEYLTTEIYPLPKLEIEPNIDLVRCPVIISASNFHLQNYQHGSAIKMRLVA